MPVPPEAVETAPWWAQLAGGIAAIGSLCAMIVAAFRPKKEESVSTAHVATETVAMVDDKPYRIGFEHIEAYLRRVADNSDLLVAIEKKRIEEEERARIRAEARIEAQEETSLKRINEYLAKLAEQDRDRQR